MNGGENRKAPGSRPSRRRKLLFYAIMLAIPLATPLVAVLGYYTYRKLTEPAEMSGSYGVIDGELGWRLKPNATARHWMRDRISGGTFFDAKIHTDNSGFRAAEPKGDTPTEAIVAIGDSWTFGYAIDYGDTFSARLAENLGRPVVNMGVPAYGSAQVVLLFERYVRKLQPKVVIHLNLGLWQRSLCHGAALPRHILKPCFWRDPASREIRIVTPRPGYVREMAARNVYPGGWLTAGNMSWGYYLISRPVTKIKQLLTSVGLLPGHQSDYDDDSRLGREAIRFTLKRLGGLARRHGFLLVIVDPPGDYDEACREMAPLLVGRLFCFPAGQWRRDVSEPASRLPEPERRVPGDGHFARGTNGLIAQSLARYLAPLLSGR